MAGSQMSRRGFCRSLLVGASALTLGRGLGAERAERPNILLITTDDLGPQLGCYGDRRARTANLDALADQGVRFENAYIMQASCSPSRSSIFTGLYPHQNGQIGLAHLGFSMSRVWPTIPSLLKAVGYRTGVIGKIHVAPEAAFPFDWKGIGHGQTRDVAKAAASAAEFLGQVAGAPFFLMVNYMDPHRPLVNQSVGVPETPFGPDDIEPFAFLGLDTPQVREEVGGYYNCAARADVGVGLLLAELAKAGHSDDTLVVFLGDNGPPFTRGKTTCYEAGLRTPLLVRWPDRAAAGLVRQELVSSVDLLPTFLAAAGLEPLEGLAGESLTGLLAGERVRWRQTLCCEYNAHHPGGWFPRRSIRDSRYKLILNLLEARPNPIRGVDGCAAWKASRAAELEGTPIRQVFDRYGDPPPVELYDLQSDPVEFHDLAGKAEYRQIEERLTARLRAWREETRDPLLDPEELASLTRKCDELQAELTRKQREQEQRQGK